MARESSVFWRSCIIVLTIFSCVGSPLPLNPSSAGPLRSQTIALLPYPRRATVRVRDWTKARKQGRTIDPKRRFKIRYWSNTGVSRVDALIGDRRARAQLHQRSSPQSPTRNHLTSVSYSRPGLVARYTVTRVVLEGPVPISRVLSVTEMHQEEILAVAKILVSRRFVKTIREGSGAECDRTTPKPLVRYLS